MIRPNELTNPGESAAYARVEALFERLDRFSAVELSMLPEPALDPDDRDRLLADAERLADRLGRGDLLDTALEHARESVLTRFVAEFRGRHGGFSPTYDPKLQAAAIRAISDAVAVAVVEDQLPTADAEALAGSARALLGRESAWAGGEAGTFTPTGVGAGESAGTGGTAPAGAPSERDWAEADHGATVVDHDAPSPGTGALRVAIMLAALFIGLPMAFLAGFNAGGALLAIAAGGAVVALVWSFWMTGRS